MRVALLLLMLVTFIGIVCAFLVMAYMKTPQARSQPNPAGLLVGTWIGEKGNVINIRPDGTARARSSANDKDFRYFEWTFDSREFAIYQYSKRHSLGWYARRAMLDDTPTDRFDVMEIKSTEFKMRTDTGEVFIFSSAHDIDLETAP